MRKIARFRAIKLAEQFSRSAIVQPQQPNSNSYNARNSSVSNTANIANTTQRGKSIAFNSLQQRAKPTAIVTTMKNIVKPTIQIASPTKRSSMDDNLKLPKVVPTNYNLLG